MLVYLEFHLCKNPGGVTTTAGQRLEALTVAQIADTTPPFA